MFFGGQPDFAGGPRITRANRVATRQRGGDVPPMKLRPVTEGPLAEAVRRLEAGVSPSAVILFGSRADGDGGPRSDHDIAILSGGRLPSWEETRSLQADLEDVLKTNVDLVLLDDASPVLAMQVLREGRLLSCRQAGALEAFIVRTLTDYADLKQVRAPIERRLMESRRP